jgi:hypothetical protein
VSAHQGWAVMQQSEKPLTDHCCAADLAAFKCIHERCCVNQAATAAVDQDGILLHLLDPMTKWTHDGQSVRSGMHSCTPS